MEKNKNGKFFFVSHSLLSIPFLLVKRKIGGVIFLEQVMRQQ